MYTPFCVRRYTVRISIVCWLKLEHLIVIGVVYRFMTGTRMFPDRSELDRLATLVKVECISVFHRDTVSFS